MRKLLLIFSLFAIHYMNAQTYEVLNVSAGYNEDVIANGVGDATASTTTGLDDADYAFMSEDFDPPGTGAATSAALPLDGVISSPNLAGLSYQLADYSSNNTLKLSTTNQSGTLTFSNNVNASNLYLLVTSGSGASTVTVEIQFTDGTSQTSTSLSVPNWYYSTALPIESQGMGRVKITTNAIETSTANPRLHRLDIPVLTENQLKLISAVQITRTSTSGMTNIFAASAKLLDDCPSPDAISSTSIGDTEASLTWSVPAVVPASYDYYYSTTNTAPTDTTTPSGNSATNSADLSGLTATTTYYFWVRSVCSTTEQGSWYGPFSFTTELCAAEDQCSYTFNLTDSFGDGWNGNTMSIIQNGVTVATLSLPSGSSATQTVTLCISYSYTIHWNSGSWTNEVGLTVVNDYGNLTEFTLPSGSGSLANTDIYTGNVYCAPITCPQPTDLVVDATGPDSADLSWTAGDAETEWEVIVVPAGDPYPAGETGTTVTDTNYTATGLDPLTEYDFYVKAVCAVDDESFWSGPGSFQTNVGNDECDTPIEVPVNSDDTCTQTTTVTFEGATVSSQADDCADSNSGDLWYSFIATSTVHDIEMVNIGTVSTATTFDDVVLSLYEGTCADGLTLLYCTAVNNIRATDLIIGETYLIRVTDNDPAVNSATQFDLCINVPQLPDNSDSFACSIRTINSSFEQPPITGIYPPVIDEDMMQGWRTTATDHKIEVWPVPNFENVPGYEGDQFIELNANQSAGVYQDFTTPAATTFTYSFAHRARRPGGNDVCQILSGSPDDDIANYTVVGTYSADNSAWVVNTGTFTTPDNQPVTRFIFTAVSTVTGDTSVGNFLDAVSFTANNAIVTNNPLTIDCDDIDVSIEAAGGGSWEVMEGNPSVTTIADANTNTTTVSGFEVPGTYYYMWNGTYCSSVLEIVFESYIVEFSYTETEVCYNADNLVPVLPDGFSVGGAFTSASGLVIDETTGEINVAESTPGTYSVTYTLPEDVETNCDTEYTTTITIDAPVYVDIMGECEGVAYMLTAEPTTENADLTGVTFAWSGPTGDMGDTQSIQAVYEGDYTVTVTSADGCVYETSTTVESTFCAIPQGISPGTGDDLNETFDLRGLNVSKIEIFNRLGTKVYSRNDYTNEWHGQTDGGNKLPVGTYFYVLHFSDEKDAMTGWVYLNY